MAQVTLRINGYAYTLGCQDGEEDHLHAMAAEVDRRIDSVKASAGPSGEARMLVIAALLLADDVHEMREKLHAAGSAAPNEHTGMPGAKPAPAADSKLSRRLGKLAKRAEDIAAGLEHP
jgi:cell division protein ZapA